MSDVDREPDAFRAILDPDGPDAVALRAMSNASASAKAAESHARAERQSPHTARAAPESGEAPSRDESAQGFRDGQDRGLRDSDEFGEAVQLSRAKRLASCTASLALAGFELHELASGAFLIVRVGFVRHATDIEAVADFLREVRQ